MARGFKQREGIDFGETFAPTVSSACVRLSSAIACEGDLDLCHFDVDQTFVQSRFDENVFLRMACSPHDVSPKTGFRTVLDRCMCFSFDRGWTYDNCSSCARR